jgi:hypothetical protein
MILLHTRIVGCLDAGIFIARADVIRARHILLRTFFKWLT